MQPTIGSLFAGIGGFDLGFERAGFKTVWQVEINEYCRKVLARHFPDAERYADIRECCGYGCDDRFGESGYSEAEKCQKYHLKPVDVICGGFPCQDISRAGKRLGFESGERSILVFDALRIVGELRPRFLLLENSSELLDRGMGDLLGALAEIGYDAEWDCIPAASVGAPHLRDRVWILAYPGQESGESSRWDHDPGGCGCLFPERNDRQETERRHDWELVEMVPGVRPGSAADWWARQSRVARSVNGLSRGLVDAANGALGNAVVPQIPELIARRLKEVL
jgi:DNA (cytosine-5)-methyltransferase 1